MPNAIMPIGGIGGIGIMAFGIWHFDTYEILFL